MIKKIFIAVICLMVIVSLAACTVDEQDDNPTTSHVTTVTTTSTTVAPKMNFEKFLETAEGIWVDPESIDWMYDDEYCFNFQSIGKDSFGGGVYPGGAERPAKITGFDVKSENEFVLSLLYEVGVFMGEELPEESSEISIKFAENGMMTIVNYNGNEFNYIFGGKDLDEAKIAVKDYAQKQY